MIEAGDYAAFRYAAENGHLDVLRYLEEKAHGRLQEMIGANNYHAFSYAAENGHLDVLRYLEEKAPERLQAMIGAGDYAAFRYAAENGHLDVLRYLEEKAPGSFQAMIGANDYHAFSYAAQNGHLDVLRYLEEKSPDRFQTMIEAGDYGAFHSAARNGHLDVVRHLLTHPSCFAYAEQHQAEYGELVLPCLSEKITSLRAQKATLELESPNAVFNVENPTEAQLLFFMARHLIRLNSPAHQDDLLFLLSIPSVRALAHTEVTQSRSNELIRLALSIGNAPAAQLLLSIPAVRQLTEQNDFYRAEVRNGLDVGALARDRESSMTALSQGERERLQAAIDRYQPMIAAAGVQNIMNDLREKLTSRYEDAPAVLTRTNGEQISLPLEWVAFQALGLSAEERNQAMRAYAQNKDHSAWRYLSRPNPWMHANASYVEVNPSNHAEKWSTFEEYQPLISMLYLAATDVGSSPIEGYTLETRLTGFIDELALIGRAHNWDRRRPSANGGTEEHDDLEGDRPSCYSGVKRRLFQSVRGHALFAILTPEILQLEINEYVRQYVSERLNDSNRASIKAILDEMIEEGDAPESENLAQLKTLDMAPESQAQFIESLGRKYGPSFSSHPGLQTFVRDSFTLNEGQSHAVNFYLVVANLFTMAPNASNSTPSHRAGPFSKRGPSGGGGAAAPGDDGPSDGKRPKR
jgi:hypothetical protein